MACCDLSRMQGQAVPFAVDYHRPEAVRADLMLGLKHLAAVGFNRGNGLVETALRSSGRRVCRGRTASRQPSKTGSR